ncbi:MAG: hypothetical protein HZA60_02560 [Deltaproteobacteria bacterium]|nr:hypothetical protein [Deltaproteobacteria bacterium]
MRKGIMAMVAATLAIAVAAPVIAGDTASPGIEQRQRNQQRRIYQGVQSGSLTPGEAARLEREQARIERQERRFKSDGDFTPVERARVQKRLNHSSRHIYRAKHNGRVAP